MTLHATTPSATPSDAPRATPVLPPSTVPRDAVLLVLRTPPPYGGGEMIAAELERLFAGRYRTLTFQRAGHSKASQGRASVGNVAFGVRYIARTSLELARHRPRVLYVDLPKDRPSFARTSVILTVALALRIRVVGDLAGGDFSFLAGGGAEARAARGLLSRLHAIRVLGATIGARLADHGLANAVAISNGIRRPASADAPSARPDDVVQLLYVGKVCASKGIFRLLDALEAGGARDGRPPWHLNVVGEWESESVRDAVLERVASGGLGPRVTFHGLAVDEAKWDIFRRCHVLVHPTDWDGQPVTILEAFAFGLPVVATRIGAIGDTVDSGVDGIVVDDPSPATLVAAIDGVVESPATYEAFSRRAREAFAQRFTVEVFAADMAALLETAAGGKPMIRSGARPGATPTPTSTGWS